MRRKSIWLTVGILALLVGGVLATLSWMIRHEPTFYQALEIEPGPTRKQFSTDCTKNYFALTTSIINNDPTWMARFSDDEINSFLQEDFIRSNAFESILPEGVHSPRISIDADRIRLAMRYGTGGWQTVITLDVRLWLVAKEPNAIAMELQGFWAGSMPIPVKSLLDSITEAGSQNNIEVRWFRQNGNPVAIMRFQADQARPTVQLLRLQLEDGAIVIAGQSLLEPSGRPVATNVD